jgi:AcrR family transcriptional regulator
MPRTARAEAGHDARERILEAALAAFAENGFEGSTTRDIAARARVTLGLVQYYYGSKLSLWKAVVDRAFREMSAGLDALAAEPTPPNERERLARLIRSYVAFVARHPEFARFMHEEGKRRGPRMRWLVDRYVKPVHEHLLSLIERAQEQGLLPADIAGIHFVYALVGAADLIFHQAEECKRLSGLDPAEPEVVAAHARAVEHLFLGPVRQEASR